MAHNVIAEAKKCLNCKKPLCRTGCPINTQIPQMIQAFLNGDIDGAGKMLFDNNPLSVICSIVCDHGRQCQGHCVRGIKGDPVEISTIENFISERYLDVLKIDCAPANGIKVAVIGSGPAGITTAIKMAQLGYDVTIFESKAKIGGVLRFGIPEFRLPKSFIDRYDSLMRGLGIKIRPNMTIGKVFGIEELFRDGFKAISIGTGVTWPNTLNIKGETLGNVHYGVHYLESPDVYDLGKSLIVIGAGNVAMDVARTALRHGVRDVKIIVRSDRATANVDELEYAEIEGVIFPKTYDKYRDLLINDNIVMVRGSIKRNNGKININIADIQPWHKSEEEDEDKEEVTQKSVACTQKVYIKIDDMHSYREVLNVIEVFPGVTPVIFKLFYDPKAQMYSKGVTVKESFVNRIKAIVGAGNIVIKDIK